MEGRFTSEELAIAKSVDLTAVAESLGYTVRRIGHYHTLKEMDSIRIYDKSHWYRWSRQNERGQNGGSQIDFLRVFAGMEVKEAVFWLLDFAGYRRGMEPEKQSLQYRMQPESGRKEEKKPFILPAPSGDNRYLYDYLHNKRGISIDTIDHFVSQGLVYEAEHYHNIVFKGNDKKGVTRFASMRGVFDKDGKGFKCDVAGNDKHYGFNVANERNDEVVVFEAAIDLMSYADMMGDFETNKLALGMVSDAPLETFLMEHPNVHTIRFCLDNDEPGRKASKSLCEKYTGKGYHVIDSPPAKGYKDYNEWLKGLKKELTEEMRMTRNDALGVTAENDVSYKI